MLTLVGEGDEVIVPTPCWVSYEDMIKLAGGVPVTVPTIEKGEKKIPFRSLTGLKRRLLLEQQQS